MFRKLRFSRVEYREGNERFILVKWIGYREPTREPESDLNPGNYDYLVNLLNRKGDINPPRIPKPTAGGSSSNVNYDNPKNWLNPQDIIKDTNMRRNIRTGLELSLEEFKELSEVD